MSGAMPRRVPTPKQLLLGHLLDHHRRLPNAAGRWTLPELERWHEGEHDQPGQDHAHA